MNIMCICTFLWKFDTGCTTYIACKHPFCVTLVSFPFQVNRKQHISQPLFLKNHLTLGNGQLQGKGKGREVVAIKGASLLGGQLKGTSAKNMRELHSRMGSRAICNKVRVVVNHSKLNVGPSQSLLDTPSLHMKAHQLELQQVYSFAFQIAYA